MNAVIHTAYAVSKRGGVSYRARAFVIDRGVKHTFTIGIGDTANEAMADAVRYVEEIHRRDGVTVPASIRYHGRLPGAIVDASLFGDVP